MIVKCSDRMKLATGKGEAMKFTKWVFGVLTAATIMPSAGWGYETADALPEGYKFYGKINVSLQRDHDFDKEASPANNQIDQHNMWHSNASRVGVKGKIKFTDDLSFIYKGELEVDANNGYNKQNNFIERREMYAGVTSKKFGSALGGKIDTPLKMLQSKVDMFGDLTAGDLKYFMSGKTRDSNTYLYVTPTWAGITVAAASINFRDTTPEPVDNNGSSMSVSYNKEKLFSCNDSLYIGLARNDGVRDQDINRFAVQYKWSVFTVGGLIQDAHKTAPGKTYPTGDRKENGHMLNASWSFTQNDTLKVQWGQSQEVEYGGTQTAIGVDHKINKNLKVYVYHAGIGGEPYQTATPAKQTDRTLMSNGIGIEYNF